MNSKHLSARDKKHLHRIKEMPCAVCGAVGPSDAHHIVQGLHYLAIPLCKDCHQGSRNGIHGEKAMWNVMRLDEMRALNNTLAALA